MLKSALFHLYYIHYTPNNTMTVATGSISFHVKQNTWGNGETLVSFTRFLTNSKYVMYSTILFVGLGHNITAALQF